MRKLILGIAAATLAVSALPAAAFAQPDTYPANAKDDVYDTDEDRDRRDQGRYDEDDGRYQDDAPGEDDAYQGETWRDGEGRLRCRRSDGTTGLIVGGAAGALVGRGIDTRGERGTGTIIGAIAGGLVGRAIERDARCR